MIDNFKIDSFINSHDLLKFISFVKIKNIEYNGKDMDFNFEAIVNPDAKSWGNDISRYLKEMDLEFSKMILTLFYVGREGLDPLDNPYEVFNYYYNSVVSIHYVIPQIVGKRTLVDNIEKARKFYRIIE